MKLRWVRWGDKNNKNTLQYLDWGGWKNIDIVDIDYNPFEERRLDNEAPQED